MKNKMKNSINKSQPLVSVIMPVYNGGEYLSDAVASILNQTYKNLELIIVDDGSTDDSLKILRQYKSDERVKVIVLSHRGLTHALNAGLEKTQGEFIARMDADDISLTNRLAIQMNYLKTHPKVIACGGQAIVIDPDGNPIAMKRFPQQHEKLYPMIMSSVPIQHPILLTYASIFKSYRYKDQYKTGEDVDMLFYILSKGKIANVPETIYKYRKSSRSNGYHNVKKTFKVTLASRITGITTYGYRPTLKGLAVTGLEFLIVSLLPSKLVVVVFEALRFDPPLWKRAKFSLPRKMRLRIQQAI